MIKTFRTAIGNRWAVIFEQMSIGEVSARSKNEAMLRGQKLLIASKLVENLKLNVSEQLKRSYGDLTKLIEMLRVARSAERYIEKLDEQMIDESLRFIDLAWINKNKEELAAAKGEAK